MTKTRNLYVMISQTDTGIGMMIRNFSRYSYNHVSVTMDESMRTWYSFIRYHHDFPFYAGFAPEPVERFLAKGMDAPVRIFKVEIPEGKARQLEQLFACAGQPDTGLLYNYFDAIAASVKRKVDIPGAYTCLSFTCAVLDKHYITIAELNDDLMPYMIYDGTLNSLTPDSGNREDPYFANVGFFRGAWKGWLQFNSLTLRLIRHNVSDLVDQRLHTTV